METKITQNKQKFENGTLMIRDITGHSTEPDVRHAGYVDQELRDIKHQLDTLTAINQSWQKALESLSEDREESYYNRLENSYVAMHQWYEENQQSHDAKK